MRPKRHHSSGPRLRRGLSLQHIPHKGEEWRWLNVVSFLVASSFIIGALLFISGGIAACLASPFFSQLTGWHIGEWKEIILVNYNYLTGHLYFVAGAYLGYFQVINVGQDERRLWAGPEEGTSISGYWGALLYFLGTLPFQISTTMMVVAPEAEGAAKVFLTWLPQAIGGVFYTAGAVVEAIHNREATWKQRVFWLCALYFAGGVLFLFAASVGTALTACEVYAAQCPYDHAHVMLWYVDLMYVIGSACFLCGAWLQLQMWKAEQFGLGFIREINPLFQKLSAPDQHGNNPHGKQPPDQDGFAGGVWSQISLALYTSCAALSAVNLALNRGWQSHADMYGLPYETGTEELLSDFTAWVAAHAMLLLATVVHYTPSLSPYDFLIWVQRGVSFLFFCDGAMRCVRYISSGWDGVEGGGCDRA